MSGRAHSYVVTTSINGSARTQVWHAEAPLSLGFPFRWVLERTERGVRVRNIATATDEVQTAAVREIPEDQLREGASVELPRGSDQGLPSVEFRIRPVMPVPPAYAAASPSGELQAYRCLGSWVLSTSPVGARFVARLEAGEAFVLEKQAGEYRLSARSALRIATDAGGADAQPGETFAFSREELLGATVAAGSTRWRFGAVQAPEFADVARPDADLDAAGFRKSMLAAAGVMALFFGLAFIWPQPAPQEELVPQEFTKIVMTAPPKATGAPTESRARGAEAPVKKAQDAKVVQAFRAKALQSAVSGLLKGGMTKLLAQSDIVAGPHASSDAKRMFASRPDALKADVRGGAVNANVKVAAVGGEGGGGGVGYRKGGDAKVAGQGAGFVNMDTFASTVDEGLTKDEVGEVIHKHLSEVRYCYESAMLRTPDIEGKLIINFTIGGPGTVKTASVKQSTLPDPRLDDCILRRLLTWKFPNTRGGVDVAVSYPFLFKTLGR
jgi:TonB family protein